MFKVDNKDTKTTPMTPTVNFEHVIAGCAGSHHYL